MRSTAVSTIFACCVLLGVTGDEIAAAESPAPNSCEYTRMFIDTESVKGDSAEEEVRISLLEIARLAYAESGWQVVSDRASAYWVMTATGQSGLGVFPFVFQLQPELLLQNDMFIAQLGDEELPERGRSGSSYNLVLSPDVDRDTLRTDVVEAADWMWEVASPLVGALCAVRDDLREEGWAGIAELRLELVEEMQRARLQREQEWRKTLELRIE